MNERWHPAPPRGRGAAALFRSRPKPPEPSRRRSVLYGSPGRVAAVAGVALGLGWLIGRALSEKRPVVGGQAAARAARLDRSRRLLSSGSAVLALSAVTDSGIEHSRNRYSNPFMYAAPTVSMLTLGASTLGACGQPAGGRVVPGIYLLAGAVGLAGFGFHVYNISQRVGGFGLLNLMYGAPIMAPGAVLGAGVAGLAANRLGRRIRDGGEPPSGRALALGSAGALAATSAEVGLLHYRGAFQNPYMVLPVTLPPVAAGALVAAAAGPTRRRIAAARTLSGATAVMGVVGSVFHAYGIHRNMGGWRNWSQMLFQGPPLPAPPGFTGVALAGLAALDLLEGDG